MFHLSYGVVSLTKKEKIITLYRISLAFTKLLVNGYEL